MLCYHMGGQLDGHILLLWQPAIVFLLLCYTVYYVCLANKLSLSLSLSSPGGCTTFREGLPYLAMVKKSSNPILDPDADADHDKNRITTKLGQV